MKSIKTKITALFAALLASVAAVLDRIVSFAETVQTTKDATDKALAKIDKGIRALEAAKAKADAEWERAHADVEQTIAAFNEAYETAAAKRRAAGTRSNRAERLIEKYTA